MGGWHNQRCSYSIPYSILHSASLLKEWYPGLESVVECDTPTICDGVEMEEWSELQDLSSDAVSVDIKNISSNYIPTAIIPSYN